MMNRRTLLRTSLAGLAGAGTGCVGRALAQTSVPTAFGFEDLVVLAEARAREPFQRPEMTLTEPFADLTYDAFRAIRFREDERLWGTDPQGFALDLMPPGFYFKDRVRVHLVDGGEVSEIPFSTAFFHFHPNYFPWTDGTAPADLARDLGFSGIRLRHPINHPGVWDEVLVFQGASYFRAVARDTLYGLSARGLAIGTGAPVPEEFPLFTDFWLFTPGHGDAQLRILALLDSASVAGAYEFTVHPGVETTMDIRVVLFPRTQIELAGIAPLTSMYYFGPERRAGVDDFRDAVHDSNGLFMINGMGEVLWRPLANPASLQYSAFQDANPRAFGLVQRQRDFAYYQDAEARYDRRPSAWIEPQSDWGPGAVTLIEIPTKDEFADNIVAFWRPSAPLEPGKGHALAYRLTWGDQPPADIPLARVAATRSGLSILDPDERVFAVDFDLGSIRIDGLTPQLSVSAGEIAGVVSLSLLPAGNIARVGFHFVAGTATASEFRLALYRDNAPVSETWLYRWTAA
jgi:periplasmic glucans biosynthesis protein